MAADDERSGAWGIAYRFAEVASNQWLLSASALALVASSIYLRRLPSYSIHDFEVLFILSSLFVVVNGLERSGLFGALASRLTSGAAAPVQIVLFTMLLSMFVTNDVAVLIALSILVRTDVPHKHLSASAAILASNVGSMLTPFGNPQNLFIYWFFDIPAGRFVLAITPLVAMLFGFVLLLAAISGNSGKAKTPPEAETHEQTRLDSARTLIYLFLLALAVLAVLRVIPLYVAGLGILYAAIFDRKSLKIDFGLLATFVCFFGFTDNISRIIPHRMAHGDIFLLSATTSQFISNVPATLLFADFTSNWHGLLWGVSVGGFGSVVGSMASIIGFRFYLAHTNSSKGFFSTFHVVNYAAFLLGALLYYLLFGW